MARVYTLTITVEVDADEAEPAGLGIALALDAATDAIDGAPACAVLFGAHEPGVTEHAKRLGACSPDDFCPKCGAKMRQCDVGEPGCLHCDSCGEHRAP